MKDLGPAAPGKRQQMLDTATARNLLRLLG